MSLEKTNETYPVLYCLLSAWLRHAPEITAAPSDWNALLQASNRHSLSAAICMALEETHLFSQCPPETAARFQEAKARSIRRTLLMDAEREKLLSFLEKEGIWYMPLKGIVLQKLYPQLGAREFADNDILFDAQRWSAVHDYMTREGFETTNIIMFSHDTYHKPPIYNFEMHRRLFSEGGNSSFLHACTVYYADVKQRLLKDENNQFGYHFSDEDFYIYTLAHAYGHYEQGGMGIRMLLDLYVYRQAKPELDEAYLHKELGKLELAAFEAACHSLADKLFGGAFPYDQITDEERKLLSAMEAFGTFGTISHRVNHALERMQGDGGPISLKTKFAYLKKQMFPSLAWYQENMPFCNRHHWAVPFFWLYRLSWILTSGRKQAVQELKALFAKSNTPAFIHRLYECIEQYLIWPFKTPVSKLPLDQCAAFAMQTYEKFEGHTFPLDHPVLFTEKQVWYKLFYEHPDMPRILDKYLFKQYIDEKLGPGYNAKLYGMWTDMRSFKRDWAALPDAFCLKSNCSFAGGNLKLVYNKDKEKKHSLFREVRRWLLPMATGINSSLRAYRNVTPCIIAEELLPGENGQLNDYKVYCFDGKPDFVGVVSDRFSSENGGAFSYYDLSWNRLPVSKRDHTGADEPRPHDLDKMLQLASLLSKGFPFMRVDFYLSEGRILVGELTPFSGNHFDQRAFDQELGEKFKLSIGIGDVPS